MSKLKEDKKKKTIISIVLLLLGLLLLVNAYTGFIIKPFIANSSDSDAIIVLSNAGGYIVGIFCVVKSITNFVFIGKKMKTFYCYDCGEKLKGKYCIEYRILAKSNDKVRVELVFQCPECLFKTLVIREFPIEFDKEDDYIKERFIEQYYPNK